MSIWYEQASKPGRQAGRQAGSLLLQNASAIGGIKANSKSIHSVTQPPGKSGVQAATNCQQEAERQVQAMEPSRRRR